MSGSDSEIASPVGDGNETQNFFEGEIMAHVVTSACFGCKHTACVTVCPVNSFREGEQMLYIDPEACIDCYECQAVCPEQAIYQEADVPESEREFIALNAEMSRTCPEISERKQPLSSG